MVAMRATERTSGVSILGAGSADVEFSGWRVNDGQALIGLAGLVMAPYALGLGPLVAVTAARSQARRTTATVPPQLVETN
jgi:hypothetical protein